MPMLRFYCGVLWYCLNAVGRNICRLLLLFLYLDARRKVGCFVVYPTTICSYTTDRN